VILHFDQPWMLLVTLLALPLIVVGWRMLEGMDTVRRATVLVLRALVVALLALILAAPSTRREHDRLTVIGLLDVSGSVRRFAELPALADAERRSYLEHLRDWFRAATETKADDDRFGLVVFDGEAIAVAAPGPATAAGAGIDVTMTEGTNIAEAIRLGLAMFPADTARRLVLVSDGNETLGSAIDAARHAAGAEGARGVPLDVLPIAYRVERDVQVVRIEAPPNAQPGQAVTVRIMLAATRETTGRLALRREGVWVDLNGDEPGSSRGLTVPAGDSVQLATVVLGDTPVNRFEAVFEPDDEGDDALPANNRAEAFTATPSRGSMLVVSRADAPADNEIARTLTDAELPVSVVTPEQLPHDLLSLQNYNLIVLDNVPAYEVGLPRQTLLSRYVNDLGGGLIMLGGEYGFGAGGWNGTPVEDVLPLELDPPRELRLPEAALVLVMDKSGSMNTPVAGARASQQEVANEAAAMAIESLRAASLVGVVTFDSFAYEHVPLQRNTDPQAIAQRVRRIQGGGGTDLEPALKRAHEMLRDVEAERKRVVVLTDGQSPTENLERIVQAMVEHNIKVSTIGVGDDADYAMLKRLAEVGEGEFYPVYNPQVLPRVLVDSVQVINKPLIKEIRFIPVVRPTGSTMTIGMEEAPPLDGLVVTAPRTDAVVTIEMTHPDGEPLLAHWQAGLGRAAAFTSDVGGTWSRRWSAWPTAGAFWPQLVRTMARPAVSQEAELIARIEDDRLHIVLEAASDEGGFLDYLQVRGTVYRPDGSPQAVRLRQTAPGRYEETIDARDAGNYIVALNPRRGQRQLAPVIGGASRTTGDEFRRYRSNLALLDQLVTMTGGRRLDLARPAAIDLFDRTGMPTSVSLLPAWPMLLWCALAALLVDVASRRIAWSGPGVRAAVLRAVAAVTPAHVTGRRAEATLASLREASTRVEQQIDAKRAAETLEPVKYEPPEDEREFSYEAPEKPEATKVSAALHTLLGRGDKAKKEGKPAPEPEEATTDEDVPPPSETTSSLLEAKRRARKRLGGRE
jgi:uncharacterized membrane protein